MKQLKQPSKVNYQQVYNFVNNEGSWQKFLHFTDSLDQATEYLFQYIAKVMNN